ncbi:MAG: decaprenyl-phosphate phosphoribosyltransferase [Candidatus Wallbacteria bacterium HGW-Wallbacteria-1]|jgi:4-hydroxybenzoate polyprenyltransferase|uniref:Decaprenyl-phosphate phosphoribosyltransferase n=1 Tax=Candidatus Wallbacteria bacterium HGW-Wallbacteria-1 TaxID=2013854 RepID=A0A2N1PLU4_9BACT|nr:MAG: decaprenyl-phosphate phosphoribosyltransferase [Candidatus Wallbacteria bacterium HGW-Wallbacteria-1]
MSRKTGRIRDLTRLLRPESWTKNLLVFAGLFFSHKLLDSAALILTVKAFFSFCFVSSSIYVINDMADRKADALHPDKCERPIASGRVTPLAASLLAMLMLALSLSIALTLVRSFTMVVISYFLLVILYTFVLKHMVILDVLAIALGFVLRAVSGAVVINVQISPWLLSCTLLMALFLALAKRRGELTTLGEDPGRHRVSLGQYTPEYLNLLLAIVTCAVIMCYVLYTFSDRTVTQLGTDSLKYTVPVVIYGIFRYLFLVVVKGKGGRPERLLFQDRGMLVTILIWIMGTGAVIYFKP